MEDNFITALSEKNKEEAIKEISLKIKAFSPKSIKHFLIFFTPHYSPVAIYQTVNFTLKPQLLIGIQSPFLIFEDRIIEKGIIGCAINKAGSSLKCVPLKNDEPQNVESSLRLSLKGFYGEKPFSLSFVTQQFNPSTYLKGVNLSLGRAWNIFGAGYIKRYSVKNYQIINNNAEEGLINSIGSGIEITSLRAGGFIPAGSPFTITRVMPNRPVIMEINNKPAINIYKYYLEEKADIFIKHRLFPFYPMGVYEDGEMRLINVIDCLDDGSLVCIGEIKENQQANLALFHPGLLFKSLEDRLRHLKQSQEEGLAFIINSLLRKKILKSDAEEEIKLIRRNLGKKFKLVGIYADYIFSLDMIKRTTNIESANSLITVWK